MRQLGYDQSVIQLMGEMGCLDSTTVESQFVGEDKAYIVSKFQSIFWPDGARVGVRTPGGSLYWRTLLDDLCTFVEKQSAESLEIPRIPLVYCNDAFLRARKRLGNFAESPKRGSGAERRSKSPPTSMEVIAARETVEEVQEEIEEEEEGTEAPT